MVNKALMDAFKAAEEDPAKAAKAKKWADKAPSSKDSWRELDNVYPKI